jgi:uncharacterized membrane protein YgdD (TMEM256/DUF423 family)
MMPCLIILAAIWIALAVAYTPIAVTVFLVGWLVVTIYCRDDSTKEKQSDRS